LNSRLRFYFRIDKERWMLIQIFFLSFSLSPWTTERKAREKKKNCSLLSFSFFSLHPNGGHFVIVQTFIPRVCVVFQIESEAKETSKTSESIYLLWKQNVQN
jgi:hypothetical protein